MENVVYAPEAATRSDIAELRAANKGQQDLVEHREAARTDIAEFRAEMAEFRAEIKSDMAEFRAEFRSDMAEFKSEIRTDIAEFRVDVERGFRGMTWRFVGLLVATQTLLFAALRMTGSG